MTQIGSWAFLGLAVVHLCLPHVSSASLRALTTIDQRVAGNRNVLLSGLLCAVIAGVLRMP